MSTSEQHDVTRRDPLADEPIGRRRAVPGRPAARRPGPDAGRRGRRTARTADHPGHRLRHPVT